MFPGTMRIALDFKGNMAKYREGIGARTTEAAARYYDDVSAMPNNTLWRTLLTQTFEVTVVSLRSDLIEKEVNSAIAQYTECSTKVNLTQRTQEEPHTCVQWVFDDGHWVAIYNYDLWLEEKFPDYILSEMGIDTTGLSIRFRAVVNFEIPRVQ